VSGELLANYRRVIDAVHRICDPWPTVWASRSARSSYAARSVAPLAVGGQLMFYVRADAESTADELGLLAVAVESGMCWC
jgi:hypothetical protein